MVAECQTAMCANWDKAKDLVGNSLITVEEVFKDHTRLEKKYGLKVNETKVGASSNASEGLAVVATVPGGSTRQSSSPALNGLRVALRFRSRRRQKQGSIGQKFTWAICGREEFEALVNELAFTIENLEKVSAHLGVLNSQKALLKHQLREVRNLESVLLLEEAATSPTPDSTQHLSGESGQRETSHESHKSTPEYIRALATEKARQINGDVGFEPGTPSSFGRYTEPTARDEATQINGAVSADALRILFGK